MHVRFVLVAGLVTAVAGCGSTAAGDACTHAADCASGLVCLEGACTTPTSCTSSRQCPGLVCDAARGVCAECVTATDCATGSSCAGGVCVTAGAACRSDRDCSSMGLVCDAAGGHCVECNGASDCTGGHVCTDHACVGASRDAGPNGDASSPDAALPDAWVPPVDAWTPGVDVGGPTSGGIRVVWTISDTYGPLSCADVGIATVMVNVSPFGGSPVTRSFRCGDMRGDLLDLPLGGAAISVQGNDASGSFLRSGGGGTTTVVASPCDAYAPSGQCLTTFSVSFDY